MAKKYKIVDGNVIPTTNRLLTKAEAKLQRKLDGYPEECGLCKDEFRSDQLWRVSNSFICLSCMDAVVEVRCGQ